MAPLRDMFGVPVPENLEDLQSLSPAQVRDGIRRLNPLVRGHVMAHMRKELDYVEQVASRKGPEAAQQAVLRQLKSYGFRTRAGEEETVAQLALRWLRALTGEM